MAARCTLIKAPRIFRVNRRGRGFTFTVRDGILLNGAAAAAATAAGGGRRAAARVHLSYLSLFLRLTMESKPRALDTSRSREGYKGDGTAERHASASPPSRTVNTAYSFPYPS